MELTDWRTRLDKSKWMSTKDKELFLKFAQDAKVKQIGDKRIEKYRTDCCIAHSMTGKNLYEIIHSEASLTKAVLQINEDKKYKFETKRDCKRTIGSLFCFLHFKDRSLKYAPKEIKQLVNHIAKPADKRIAKPVIKRAEIREMTQYANTREKCLLMLLFESGMRVGELIPLKKSDIHFIEEGAEIIVCGKTGERKIFVEEIIPYLRAWLAEHPVKGKDALLFPRPRTADGKITIGAIAKTIREVIFRMNQNRKEQGLPEFTTPANPHNFRHSRASELGGEPGMTEAILCKYFGWELDSDMPKIYIHLTDTQVKRAIMRTYGRAKNEEPELILTARTCPKCHEENPIAMGYCGRCGYDLNAKKMPSRLLQLEARLAKLEAAQEKKIRTKMKG